jgi:hypothetical protein
LHIGVFQQSGRKGEDLTGKGPGPMPTLIQSPLGICQDRFPDPSNDQPNPDDAHDWSCIERAAKTKRTLKQVQNVLDRLHEEISGQRVVRTTFKEYLSDWLMAKKAETASSTMDFYQTSFRSLCSFSVSGRMTPALVGRTEISPRLPTRLVLSPLAALLQL